MANPNCSRCGELKQGSYVLESWCGKCVAEKRRERRARKKAAGLPEFGDKRKKECNACRAIKELNYMNDSLCKACRSTENKEKRAQERASKGLPEWGSGERSPFCSKCGDVKDKAFMTSGYCRKCKLESRAKKTSERRLAAGLGEWGSGEKKIYCCRCNAVKENRENGYCNSCSNLLNRQKYHKKYSSPEAQEKKRQKINEKYKNDLEYKLQRRAHDMVQKAIAKGSLIVKPCEVCETQENIDAHHDNYHLPLDVRWLCRKHHNEHHNEHHKNLKLEE